MHYVSLIEKKKKKKKNLKCFQITNIDSLI